MSLLTSIKQSSGYNPLQILNGGTGGTSVATARTGLGIGTTDSPTFGGLTITGTNKLNGYFYAGDATPPDGTTRLNYDGHLYATKFYGDGSGLVNAGANIAASTVSSGTWYIPMTQLTTGSMTAVSLDNAELYYNAATSVLYTPSIGGATEPLAVKTKISFEKPVKEKQETLTGTPQTLNFDNGSIFYITLADGVNTITLPDPASVGSGYQFTIIARQSANGSDTITWSVTGSSAIIWAANNTTPVLTTTANRADIISFISVTTGANTRWWGMFGASNFNPV